MKNLDDLRIFDAFTKRGRWFLPGTPDDSVPGELAFSSSGIRLRLDSRFKAIGGGSVEWLVRSEPFRAPVLLERLLPESLLR